MFNDENSKQFCKIGGPFVLLVCCPVVAWISFSVFKKAIDAGEIIKAREYFEIGLINLFLLFVGGFYTYKGFEEKFWK